MLTIDVVALLERLNRIELKLKNLEDEQQGNFDNLVDHVPRIENGKVMCKVFTDDDMVDLELKDLSDSPAKVA